MSKASIELAVSAFEAWNRGDYEAWIEAFDDECEFRPLRAQLEGHAYRGHAGLRRFASELTDEWSRVQFVLDEIRDDGDVLVATARFGARGRASGAELDLPIGVTARLRAGKFVECRMYADPADAWSAAGLSP